jgi:hypothetical protein
MLKRTVVSAYVPCLRAGKCAKQQPTNQARQNAHRDRCSRLGIYSKTNGDEQVQSPSANRRRLYFCQPCTWASNSLPQRRKHYPHSTRLQPRLSDRYAIAGHRVRTACASYLAYYCKARRLRHSFWKQSYVLMEHQPPRMVDKQ